MGHSIEAIICRGPVDTGKAAEMDLPLLYEGGFIIIPLNSSHSDFWAEKLGVDHDAYSEMIHDRAVTLAFAKALGISKFALVETEYFGAIGEQFATIYKDGNRVSAVENDGINNALRKIGVVVSTGLDEFDTIGLGKYRDFSQFFEKYW